MPSGVGHPLLAPWQFDTLGKIVDHEGTHSRGFIYTSIICQCVKKVCCIVTNIYSLYLIVM